MLQIWRLAFISATLLQIIFRISLDLQHYCNYINSTDMKLTKNTFLTLLFASTLMTACKKDEPVPQEDNENLTTVSLKFTEKGVTKTFSFKDLDGDGGNAPTIDKISLEANKTYSFSVELLDETKSPVVDVTEEIEEQKDEHLFEYMPTPSSVLVFSNKDKDSRGYDVGLTATVTTSAAGTGKLHVVLHHQPPVNGTPIKNGSFTVGSTDFDGTFEVEVK
jgi:hypothetical protein